MDTHGPTPDDVDADAPSRLHVSTGQLTGVHARTVQSWRQALRAGGEDRARASTSDCLAVAVHALLDSCPDPLAVAAVAEAGRRARADARTLGSSAVSVYVAATDADAYLDLTERACLAVQDLADSTREELIAAGRTERAAEQAVVDLLWRRGLPVPRPGRQLIIPRGALARLALQTWAGRSPTAIVQDAADWAASHHRQLHRARQDMRHLH